MAFSDGIRPSVFHRELETNYGVVPLFPTHSPTESSNHRRNYWRKSAVGISQIVWKKLRVVPLFPTDSPTDASNHRRKYRRNYSVGISQRVWKKLRVVSLFPTESPTELTDGHHRRKLHIPKRPLSEKPLLPTDKNKRRHFQKFGAHFNLFLVGITVGNKCHRQHLMFRR